MPVVLEISLSKSQFEILENDVCRLLFVKTLHLLIINKPYFFQQRNDKEECLVDYHREIVKRNQFILNLLHQFGDSGQ